MIRAGLALLVLAACGDDLPTAPRYWSCTSSAECGDVDCVPLRGAAYCTVRCETTDDCLAHGWPAVCSDGWCWGECWPGGDLEFCRRYGFLCPSDCEAQGLTCDLVTGGFSPRYGCVAR